MIKSRMGVNLTEEVLMFAGERKKRIAIFLKTYMLYATDSKRSITTYGAIASYLGTNQVREWWLGYEWMSQDVPSHRVVIKSDYVPENITFPNSYSMEKASQKGRYPCEDDQIQNLQDHFWDPAVELERSNSVLSFSNFI